MGSSTARPHACAINAASRKPPQASRPTACEAAMPIRSIYCSVERFVTMATHSWTLLLWISSAVVRMYSKSQLLHAAPSCASGPGSLACLRNLSAISCPMAWNKQLPSPGTSLLPNILCGMTTPPHETWPNGLNACLLMSKLSSKANWIEGQRSSSCFSPHTQQGASVDTAAACADAMLLALASSSLSNLPSSSLLVLSFSQSSFSTA